MGGQILSQMKACYANAIEGAGGKVTSRLLNTAVAAGKRARDETDISKGAVSISSEGYDVDIDVVASDGDEQVAYDLARDADIIFTASSAVDYIFDAENIGKLDRQAGREKLMLVDIAVPRNVDPACDDLDDVRAYDVASLKAVVERNTAKRRREIVEAEKLLEEEQASFRAWITSLGAVPAITKLQTKAEDLRQAELKRADKKLQSLSSREIEAVERLSRGIVSKLLHGPMSSLRGEGSTDDKKNP